MKLALLELGIQLIYVKFSSRYIGNVMVDWHTVPLEMKGYSIISLPFDIGGRPPTDGHISSIR